MAGSAPKSPPTRPFWCFATSNSRSTSARGPASWGLTGISISRAITNFDLARDYYVNFHDLNPRAPQSVLGMPLLITAGMAQVPGPREILVSSGVTDYVGVQPGAEATVEFIYNGAGEPIIKRFDGLRLIGTFDMAGPDQGRFEPFWRFNARGQDVLTVRREPQGISATSLPLIVNAALFRDFLSSIG